MHTLAAILDLAGYELCALYTGETTARLLHLLQPQLDIIDLNARSTSRMPRPRLLLQAQRCKILLFNGQTSLHDLLRTRDALTLPFELLTRPIRIADLISKLHDAVCSESPPLLVPIETEEAPVH